MPVFKKKKEDQSTAVIRGSMAARCTVVLEETAVAAWKTSFIMHCASVMNSVKGLETVVPTSKVLRNHAAWEMVSQNMREFCGKLSLPRAFFFHQ